MITIVLSILNIVASLTTAHAEWIDKSHGVFLPPALSEQLGARSSFPVFWWGFAVIERPASDDSWTSVTRACERAKAAPRELIARVACDEDLTEFRPLLEDWARDYKLRHAPPSPAELKAKLDQAMAKASLPVGQSILWLLRADPLESYQELRELLEKRLQLRLTRDHGVFYDPETRRAVIPIQFTFPPNETAKTRRALEALGDDVRLLGAHASTIENESQVLRDVGVVSVVGVIVLVLTNALILYYRRWRLILLVPPVLFSTLLSAALTKLVFGSIHGLTLSFGTAIIGLAADYGLHSALNQQYEGNWRANVVGVLTTIVALVVLMFSEIPLLRQMMVFSMLGLGVGFLSYYVLHKRYPRAFSCEPFEIRPTTSPARAAIVLVFVASAFLSLFWIKPKLDMSQFDYQDKRGAELRIWLYKHLEVKAPLLAVDAPGATRSTLVKAHADRQWGAANGVVLENVAGYLPELSEQGRNVRAWNEACGTLERSASEQQKKFFEPFFKSVDCGHASVRALAGDGPTPEYVKDFSHDGRWLSLWLPKDDGEVARVKERDAGALSLKDVASIFPNTLARELKWMAPLSLLLATALLGAYYRRLSLTLLSLLPFFAGFGLFAIVSAVTRHELSFVSLVGLVMVFGFSIDYGVFATDLARDEKSHSVTGVWTSLSLAALTNAAGFAPLLFCKHPVLGHLGQVLVYGTVGTYLGAIWGVPSVYRLMHRRTAA